MSGYHLSVAVFNLQTDTATVNEKVESLRFLKHHLDDHGEIDAYNKKRINQLILDNILKLILSEEKSVDVRKKQLIRTELFVMLADVLRSNTLFGQVLNDPAVLADERLKSLNSLTTEYSDQDITRDDVVVVKRRVATPATTFGAHNFTNELHSHDWMVSSSERHTPIHQKTQTASTPDSKHTKKLSISTSNSSLDQLKLHMLKPALLKNSRKLMSKTLKPRPSVLFSDKLEHDGFVPGVDPLNFIEQDRRLGYQKPRMWFPKADVRVDSNMVPAERGAKSTNRVVEEYLQMRALASYVGDLVMPYAPGKRKHAEMEETQPQQTLSPVRVVKHKKNSKHAPESPLAPTSLHKTRLAGFTDPQRFNDALSEAVAIWTPLLGVHLPKWIKHAAPSLMKEQPYKELKPFAYLNDAKNNNNDDATATSYAGSDEDGTYDDSTFVSSQSAHSHHRHREHHKDVPQPDNHEPSNFHVYGEYSLRSKRRRLMPKEENPSYATQMKKYQSDMISEIETQKNNLLASIKATESMIQATMKSQYTSLPPKYIVLLEGGKANARKIIANTFFIFCRVRKHNLLTLAMGIWKILLVTSRSLALRPKYSKVASMYLMATWALNLYRKNLRIFLSNWRRSVTMLIFNERTRNAITFQKNFRCWRDRRKFVRMHLAGTFNGILSDIYLAPRRKDIQYRIPDTIRTTRRMLWLAAIIIQSRTRCYLTSKDYFFKRKKVVKLQSCGRMWPKRLRFLRLRRAAIKCQAWTRRTVKRNRFKLMKRSAIIIERYVRRYLSTLRVWRLKMKGWRFNEKILASIIMIQCRWREYAARKKVRAVKFYHAMRQYSALVIQRNYFRFRRAFHTFFLMCALRVREEEDIKLENLSIRMGRNQCARKIQRIYKERHRIRVIGSVIRVQCWYRGRLGYNMVDILRRERWASRKLRHWGRIRMRRRTKATRKICGWWLHLKKGRLLAHLKRRRAERDRLELIRITALRNKSATIIQKRARGIAGRVWMKRHRAARKIQKNYRFFAGLRRWKNWKRKKILNGVTKYVEKQFRKAITTRVGQLLRRHSLMLIKPQALVRGFLVRIVFWRVREHGYRMGLAAVLIQRFWRKTGALSKAVDEVMALRRMSENPFKECSTLHEVLNIVRKQSVGLFSQRDPRAGMKVSTLMLRLGLYEMVDMFPKKEFRFVSDMQRLTMDRITTLYNQWKLNQAKAKKKNNEEEEKKKKPKAPPVAVFQLILDIVTPAFFTKKRVDVEKIMQIQSLPEYLTPNRMIDFSKKIFLKKFGKHLLVKAQNISNEIMELVWKTYNNYKAVGYQVTTAQQVMKAMNNATEASHIISSLEEIRQKPPTVVEDRKWDKERVKNCADLLQLAMDQCKAVLPPGTLFDMIEKAAVRCSSHRRKMSFLHVKLFQQVAKAAAAAAKKSKNGKEEHTKGKGAKSDVSVVAHHSDDASEQSREVGKLTPLDQMNKLLSASDSVDLAFNGNEDDLELELQIGICKIYFEVLDKLQIASAGVNSLKNMWSNSAIKRVMNAEKLKMFLDSVTKSYIKEQNEDHVKITWNKFKRIELIAQKLKVLIKTIQDAKAEVEAVLLTIPRYGWEAVPDDYGYHYWVDTKPHSKEEYTYDMPNYTLTQWRKAIKIQRLVRVYLVEANERYRIKMELKQIEMDKAKAALEEEMRKGARELSCVIVVKARPIKPEIKQKAITNKFVASLVPTVESLLPWKYQFEVNPIIKSGIWALIKHHNVTTDHTSYDIVMIFKLKPAQKHCDVRTVKGSRMRNVHLDRIVQMNLDVGTRVEVRHKGRKVFYRGTIKKIDDYTQPHLLYTVLYDDGESESGLNRDLIRPTTAALQEYLTHREKYLLEARIQHKRQLHYTMLKQKRFAAARSATAPAVVAQPSTALVIVTAPVEAVVAPTDNPETTPEVLAIENGKDDDQSKVTEDGNGEGDGNDNDTASVHSHSQMSVNSKNSQETEQTELTADVTLPSSSLVIVTNNDNASTNSGTNAAPVVVSASLVQYRFRIDVRVFAKYSKYPLRYGCTERKVPNSWAMEYWDEWGQEVGEKPVYSAEQVLMVFKCQQCWLLYKARKMLHRKALSYSLGGMIDHVVEKCCKIAFIGFGVEGVTTMMFLRRAGYFELAEGIELYFKTAKKNISTLSLEDVINKTKDDYDTIGIIQQTHLKDIRDLQAWWKKTAPADRIKRLQLFNYFTDYNDTRSIQQCVAESEEIMFKKFTKLVKTSQTRTRQAVANLVKDANYPHAHLQVENYLRRYADKPEMARDAILELMGKPTTHTWVDERIVFKHYRHVTRQIIAILRNLKLKKLLKTVSDAAKRADAIMKIQSEVEDKGRPMCSGPEARAAWILRQDVLHFMSTCVNSVIHIQRKVRSYRLAKSWRTYLEARVKSTNLIQRVARRYAAYKIVRYLYAQQYSEWEQLWDLKRKILYYYNNQTGQSTYEEPPGPFRPLVRDPKSALLIQAWPHIGNNSGDAVAPNGSALVPKNAPCGLCKTRQCVRICYDCTSTADATLNNRFPYCFTCFIKEHTEEKLKNNHNFDVMEFNASQEQDGVVLRCCTCDNVATRKCMGAISDAKIDAICADLRVTEPHKWGSVLQKADVAGDRKINLLLDQVRSGDSSQMLSSSQLQEVRALLERMRSECDECYCATCYVEVHSGGKRATHTWKGFKEGALVCKVCSNCPAESKCLDCPNEYCDSCFKAFHEAGRKKRHRKEVICEDVGFDEVFCGICKRRAGNTTCPEEKCSDIQCCDSCYECIHKPKCDRDIAAAVKRKQAASKAIMDSSTLCVVCGDPADARCHQCGDFYCSKTWMGNPGCFISYHNKGNRANHTVEAIRGIKSMKHR